MSSAWSAAGSADGAEMDVIICPAAPAAGIPHDFPVWWGYTSIWNLLDYPSIIMPMEGFKIDTEKDAKDTNYQPTGKPYDEENWKICKTFLTELICKVSQQS